MIETKICIMCEIEKPLSEFQNSKTSKGGKSWHCKPCVNKKCRKNYQENKEYFIKKGIEWGKNNPEKVVESSRKWYKNNPKKVKSNRLKHRYGMTTDDYDRILESQNGVCAICKQKEPIKGITLAVDHNHDTGAIRGLLYNKCNKGLGYFNDNPNLVETAAEYLAMEHSLM